MIWSKRIQEDFLKLENYYKNKDEILIVILSLIELNSEKYYYSKKMPFLLSVILLLI